MTNVDRRPECLLARAKPALAAKEDPECDDRSEEQPQTEHEERPRPVLDMPGQESEVLPGESGEERELQEDRGDDRQLLGDLAFAVSDRRQYMSAAPLSRSR